MQIILKIKPALMCLLLSIFFLLMILIAYPHEISRSWNKETFEMLAYLAILQVSFIVVWLYANGKLLFQKLNHEIKLSFQSFKNNLLLSYFGFLLIQSNEIFCFWSFQIYQNHIGNLFLILFLYFLTAYLYLKALFLLSKLYHQVFYDQLNNETSLYKTFILYLLFPIGVWTIQRKMNDMSK